MYRPRSRASSHAPTEPKEGKVEKARSARGVGGLGAEELWSADGRDLVPCPVTLRRKLAVKGQRGAAEPQGRPGSHGVLGILRAREDFKIPRQPRAGFT